MYNISLVTEHLRNKVKEAGGDIARECLEVVKAKDGKPYFVDEEGEYWRTYKYIDDVYFFALCRHFLCSFLRTVLRKGHRTALSAYNSPAAGAFSNALLQVQDGAFDAFGTDSLSLLSGQQLGRSCRS